MRDRLKAPPGWALVLGAFTVYCLVYIWQTSFVIDGVRYFCLFDDAMISMRYAENLANGDGLVWNPGGERVEGFTNLLWVLYMAGLHLLPVGKAKISLLVQLSGAGLLVANLAVVRRLAGRLEAGAVYCVPLAVGLTALYLPLNMWTLQGFEVGSLTLLLTLAAYRLSESHETGDFDIWPYLLIAVSVLVRLDAIVPFLVIWASGLVYQKTHRTRHLLVGGSILAASLVSQTLFRLLYYGEILPNTYYLKMTGISLLARVGRGLVTFLEFAHHSNWVLLLLAASALVVRRTRAAVLLIALVAGQFCYSIWVGGDAWEWWGGANRHIVVAMPLLFVLLARQFSLLFASLSLPRFEALKEQRPFRLTVLVIALAVFSLSLNARYGPKAWAEWMFVEPPIHTGDNRLMTELALTIKRVTDSRTTVAVTWAGTTPYFAERESLDLLGKNDPVIARQDSHLVGGFKGFLSFKPGHSKWDYDYSVTQLRPDVVVGPMPYDEVLRDAVAPYDMFRLEHFPVFVRRDVARPDLIALGRELELGM